MDSGKTSGRRREAEDILELVIKRVSDEERAIGINVM